MAAQITSAALLTLLLLAPRQLFESTARAVPFESTLSPSLHYLFDAFGPAASTRLVAVPPIWKVRIVS